MTPQRRRSPRSRQKLWYGGGALALLLATTVTVLWRWPSAAQTPAPDPLFASGQGTWAGGLNWRQQAVRVGNTRFPMTALEFTPQQSPIVMRPIWSTPNGMAGTEPLVTMARRWRVAAAINGGFLTAIAAYPWVHCAVMGSGCRGRS
ncbi:MAG: hypothetical protein HC910_12805 [Spirulinaceae cyanobacterium SM2_1_0]|nr:hypothetical protein [Spirulinaceae cyanobacterium SM2_1_0]